MVWEPYGTPSGMKNLLDVDEDRRRVFGECGGYCGGCRARGGKLKVEVENCQKEFECKTYVARQPFFKTGKGQECSVSLIAFDVKRTQHLILEFLGYPGVQGIELFSKIFSSCVRILGATLNYVIMRMRITLVRSWSIKRCNWASKARRFISSPRE